MRRLITVAVWMLAFITGRAQDVVVVNETQSFRNIYKLSLEWEIPYTAVATAWDLYGLHYIYNKGEIPAQTVLSLNRNTINSFDRRHMHAWNHVASDQSDVVFGASIPFPLLVFLVRPELRHSYGKLAFLYWETLATLGLSSVTTPYFADRYRPYVYFDETPWEKRTSQISRNSFYAGHVAIVAASTFFTAKVFNDYYPESGWKYFFWGLAATSTATIGVLRMEAGSHFPSDVMLGAVAGTITGILVPHFHKTSVPKLSMLPYSDGLSNGISLTYRPQKAHHRYIGAE